MSTPDPTQHNRGVGGGQPPSYPPLPPPPAPQLPDFKPKGMSQMDKSLAWLAGFVVLIFLMIVAAHFILKPAAPTTAKPVATVTHSAPAHHSASSSCTH